MAGLIEIATVLSLMAPTGDAFIEDEHECLARVVYHEAIGERTNGQIGVAYTVINRVNEKFLGDSTYCDVVKHRTVRKNRTVYQYSWAKNWDTLPPMVGDNKIRAYQIAYSIIYHEVPDPTNGSKFFWNPSISKSKFHESLKFKVQIGNHKFANDF